MSTKNVFSFQGGKRRHINIPATAGNIVTNKSPGVGFRWIVVRGLIEYDADANAANRYLRFEITDGTKVVGALGGAAVALVANENLGFAFGEQRLPDEQWDQSGMVGLDVKFYTGMEPFLLEGADELRFTALAGLVGDSYVGSYTVLEMKL